MQYISSLSLSLSLSLSRHSNPSFYPGSQTLRVTKCFAHNNLAFQYITYMITPEHNNPYPGVMKLTIKLTILSSSLLYTYEGLSDRLKLKHLSVDQ